MARWKQLKKQKVDGIKKDSDQKGKNQNDKLKQLSSRKIRRVNRTN